MEVLHYLFSILLYANSAVGWKVWVVGYFLFSLTLDYLEHRQTPSLPHLTVIQIVPYTIKDIWVTTIMSSSIMILVGFYFG